MIIALLLVYDGYLLAARRDVCRRIYIVTPNGQVVLIDFGLAWPFGKRRPSRAGTPPYIPPEILGGWPLAVDGRADQYSLGVILTCGGCVSSTSDRPARPHSPGTPAGPSTS